MPESSLPAPHDLAAQDYSKDKMFCQNLIQKKKILCQGLLPGRCNHTTFPNIVLVKRNQEWKHELIKCQKKVNTIQKTEQNCFSYHVTFSYSYDPPYLSRLQSTTDLLQLGICRPPPGFSEQPQKIRSFPGRTHNTSLSGK